MVQTASADPVKCYHDSLQKLHIGVRHHTPFIYLAYNSLLPTAEDDFIGLAYKVGYFVTFRFFIQLGTDLFSPWCAIIPIVPFVLDFLWISYHWIVELKSPVHEVSGSATRHHLTSLFYVAASAITIHALNRVPPY